MANRQSPTSPDNGASGTATAPLDPEAIGVLLALSEMDGRILPVYMRHVGTNGEYVRFGIVVDYEDMSVVLRPTQPWPWKRDWRGDWVYGPAVIYVRDYLARAQKAGKGREGVGRLREAMIHVEGEADAEKITLRELQTKDPTTYEKVVAIIRAKRHSRGFVHITETMTPPTSTQPEAPAAQHSDAHTRFQPIHEDEEVPF